MKNQAVGRRVILCEDGKYRWVYELSLFKDPTVFLLVYKILLIISLAVLSVVVIADTANWGVKKAIEDLPFFGWFLIGMTVLTVLGYLVYAAVMGGKYVVEFEMDEKGINHTQTASQAKKAKSLGKAASVGGLASGRITFAGVGMSAQRTQMYSDFSSVRRVKAYPKRQLIKVNGRLSRNQVYAPVEDLQFVKDYIISHCPDLKD